MNNISEKVAAIIVKYYNSPEYLISILQDIQDEYRHLPESALRMVAQRLNLPAIQVFGVATFFKAFSLEPCGRHMITLCMGTACHIRGAPAVLDELKRELGIEPGQTTKDMQFTLDIVNCLGACALGPIMVVDGIYYGQMNPGKVQEVLGKLGEATESKKYGKNKVRIGAGTTSPPDLKSA